MNGICIVSVAFFKYVQFVSWTSLKTGGDYSLQS